MEIDPRPATIDELMLVHTRRHVERVRLRCENGGLLDNGDTVVGAESYEIARLAAGAVLRCVDGVMGGEFRRAFAAIRPPGHHAEPNASMGFCLFSNLAIAARYAQQKYALERIAIVDFDAHHGNGTQAEFQTDPCVFFVSIHEDPHTLYPYSGYKWEIGAGAGRGSTLNVPMPADGGDEQYLAAMSERIVPRLLSFRPQLLMISAGFDAHRDDPESDMNVTDKGFNAMTRMLAGAANECCDGKIVSVLEGGYDLRALGRSVVAHLQALV